MVGTTDLTSNDDVMLGSGLRLTSAKVVPRGSTSALGYQGKLGINSLISANTDLFLEVNSLGVLVSML